MTTKEMIGVMQAFVEGKTIQFTSNGGIEWEITTCPSWNWDRFTYRVKPEKEYRPYENTDEMIEDWKTRFEVPDWPTYSMPLIWVVQKGTDRKIFLSDISMDDVTAVFSYTSMNGLLEGYTYLDGSPCGKETEE